MMIFWSDFQRQKTALDEGSDTASKDVTVNVPDKATLLSDLEARFAARRGFRVATLNLDHVVKLRRSPDFAAAYGQQTHITADGNPIVWLSRLAGEDISLLPGSDLVIPVAECAARTGVSLVLLGSSDAALAGAAETLLARCPGIEISLCVAPPMGFDPTGPFARDIVAQIDASGAGLCLIALGAPKQEIFAAFAGKELPNVGFLSIGAGLDFLAGYQTRAPRWVRRIAAEWLWRLMQNPRRLARRYGACLAILPGLTAQAIAMRLRRVVQPGSADNGS